MKCGAGGSGIRTHDASDMRQTLNEHSYGRSDMKICIFHESKEKYSYLVQSGGIKYSI